MPDDIAGDNAPQPTDWSFIESERPRVVAWLISCAYAPEVADDACAAALLELYQRSVEKGRGTTVPMLYRYAKWRAEDERRAMERRLRHLQEIAPLHALAEPDHDAIARVQLDEVAAELRNHSELERKVVYLREVLDYTEKEAADACGKTVKSVERALARARSHVRKLQAVLLLPADSPWRRIARQCGITAVIGAAGLSVPLVAALRATPVATVSHAAVATHAAPHVAAAGTTSPGPIGGMQSSSPGPVSSRVRQVEPDVKTEPGATDTVIAIQVGDPSLISGSTGLERHHDDETLVGGIVSCIEHGPSLDPHDAGCPG